MFAEDVFTKENIDKLLNNLSKEFRKSTSDIDAVITSSSVMKEAINIVGEKYELPNGWLNMDFKNTTSYTDKVEFVEKYPAVINRDNIDTVLEAITEKENGVNNKA